MVIMAVVGAAIAIWGSVLGCKVTCCGGPTTGVSLQGVPIKQSLRKNLLSQLL